MEHYLVIGGVLFWLFVAIASVGFVIAAACESFSGVFILAGALLILAFGFSVDVLRYMPHTWYGWLLAVIGYVSIGALWSVYKFYVVYREKVKEIVEYSSEFQNGGPDDRRKFLEGRVPKASAMKERIIAWIGYWPISIAIYFLSDFLHHLFEKVYEWFSGIYESMASRIRESFVNH